MTKADKKYCYFDEAGFTGPNLLDKEQRFFTMASALFSNDELEVIRKDIAYDKYGKELHFNEMHGDKDRQKIILDLLTHPLMDNQHIRISYAYKRYCIYAQIINILVETYEYENNKNIYKYHNALFQANDLYNHCFKHTNKSLIRKLENDFVIMINKYSKETRNTFYIDCTDLINDQGTNEALKKQLKYILSTELIVDSAWNKKDKTYLDLSLPLFFSLVNDWHINTKCKLDVLYDKSNLMSKHHDIIKNLCAIPEYNEVGYGNRKMVFPLQINSMNFEDSKNSFGIQIADIVVSALFFKLNEHKHNKAFREKLDAIQIFKYPVYPLVPSDAGHLLCDLTEDFSNSIDPVDFLMNNVPLT